MRTGIAWQEMLQVAFYWIHLHLAFLPYRNLLPKYSVQCAIDFAFASLAFAIIYQPPLLSLAWLLDRLSLS